MRNAKQKKAVPAKNSEANFWRPGTQGPLRAGKRANANFACSEGFFCARRAAPSAGAAAFSKPAAVVAAFVPGVCLPAVRLCVRVFRLSFAFFCLEGAESLTDGQLPEENRHRQF